MKFCLTSIKTKWCPPFPLLALTTLTAIGLAERAPAQVIGRSTDKYYQLQQIYKFDSANSSWDYIDFQQSKHYAYLNRRADGVTVIDVVHNRIVAQIANSGGASPGVGSNGTVFAEDVGLGFTSNGDGSTTVFRLSDFKTLAREQIAPDFDGNAYEPVTHTVVWCAPNEKRLYLVNVFTGIVDPHPIDIPSGSPERPHPDGLGNLIIPCSGTSASDPSQVLKVNVASKTVTSWAMPTVDTQPVGCAIDTKNNRIFLGCRGNKSNPQLLVLDSTTGGVVASGKVPGSANPVLGRGNDDVVFDADTDLIYCSNGVDGNIVIFHQDDPFTYTATEAIQTQPGVRGIVLDTVSKKIYGMNARGIRDMTQSGTQGPSFFYPNNFVLDSFVLLSYGRGTPAKSPELTVLSLRVRPGKPWRPVDNDDDP